MRSDSVRAVIATPKLLGLWTHHCPDVMTGERGRERICLILKSTRNTRRLLLFYLLHPPTPVITSGQWYIQSPNNFGIAVTTLIKSDLISAHKVQWVISFCFLPGKNNTFAPLPFQFPLWKAELAGLHPMGRQWPTLWCMDLLLGHAATCPTLWIGLRLLACLGLPVAGLWWSGCSHVPVANCPIPDGVVALQIRGCRWKCIQNRYESDIGCLLLFVCPYLFYQLIILLLPPSHLG